MNILYIICAIMPEPEPEPVPPGIILDRVMIGY